MAGAHQACTIEVGDGTYWVPGTWTDFSARVHSWQVSGGFQSPWMPPLRWSPMRATIVMDNSDRALDPRNTASAYYSSTIGGLTVRPGSPVRIKIATIGVFYGTLDDIGIASTRTPASRITITATDATKILSRAAVTPYSVAEGAGETIVQRLERLADAVDWPAGMRSFDAEPDVTVQATTLSGPIWQQMQLTAESGGGYIYPDPNNGSLLYRARSYDATQSVIRYWSNQNTYAKGITVEAIQSSGLEVLRNQVRYARVGGTEIKVEDSQSIADHGIADLSRSDLICEDDTTVADLAALALSVAPKPRPQIVEIRGSTASGSWQNELIYTRVGDRIELLEAVYSSANVLLYTISQESFVRSGKWSAQRVSTTLFAIETVYGIQPSWAWDSLTLNSSTKGVLGQNVTVPTSYGTTFSDEHVFASSDEVYAAELNSLMDMRWQVFADAAARDAAYVLSAPVSGTHPIVLLLDTSLFEIWDGSQWVPLAQG